MRDHNGQALAYIYYKNAPGHERGAFARADQKIVFASLAEDISWAIMNLLNRDPGGIDPDSQFVKDWKGDFENWCAQVSANWLRRIEFYQNPELNHQLSLLRLKIDRLRDVINWTQERRR